MAYRRFKLPEISWTSATVATPATVSSQPGPSVAKAATVATPEPNSETPNPPMVTRVEPKSDHRPHTTIGANGQATECAVSSVASASVATLATGSDGDDQAALAVTNGVPAVYATAFANLQACCPTDVPEARWRQAVNDAALFLDQWGETADRLGWTARN